MCVLIKARYGNFVRTNASFQKCAVYHYSPDSRELMKSTAATFVLATITLPLTTSKESAADGLVSLIPSEIRHTRETPHLSNLNFSSRNPLKQPLNKDILNAQ